MSCSRALTVDHKRAQTNGNRYVVQACQGSTVVDVVVKAIDLAHPVVNLGGESLPFMSASWRREELDGDAVQALFRPSNLASTPADGCAGTDITTGNGTASLAVGCGLVTRSLEARTINVFRFPLSIQVADITVDRDAVISIGLVSRLLFTSLHAASCLSINRSRRDS